MDYILTAPEFDPSGFIALPVFRDQGAGEAKRRVTRVATLDGGAAINDFGYADADRTIELRWPTKDRATSAAVERLMRLYGRLHVSTVSGFFSAAPETFTPGVAESRLRLLVVERLSE